MTTTIPRSQDPRRKESDRRSNERKKEQRRLARIAQMGAVPLEKTREIPVKTPRSNIQLAREVFKAFEHFVQLEAKRREIAENKVFDWSINKKMAIEASEMGYRVDEKGDLYNPQGKKLYPGIVEADGKTYQRIIIRDEDGVRRSTFTCHIAAYQRWGLKAFVRGACYSYRDGNATNLSTENFVLTDRHSVMKGVEKVRRTPEVVKLTRVAISNGFVTRKEAASKLGVTKKAIGDWVRRRTWKHDTA